jgi:uncharacterized RDD family membrane protein YckC
VCGAGVAGVQGRCPACGAGLGLATEGSLAPDPLAASRARTEPLRDLPGARKKERTWRDEVNERLKDRKRRRQSGAGSELPLFDDAPGSPSSTEPAAVRAARKSHATPAPPEPDPVSLERALDDGLRGERDTAPFAREDALPDLPLQSATAEIADTMEAEADAAEAATTEAEAEAPLAAIPPAPPTPAPRTVELGEDSLDRPREEEWPLELEPPAPSPTPVERPAWFAERAQAGAVDLALLVGLWSIVVYFASRTAHVAIAGLLPTWPFLGGFLAFLGLVYAAYFTGTTGQSLGKILCGLRVVDTAGRPPGYARSFARAALGAVGVVALGAGLLPMAFDPARRALHDRLFRTRVVKG